MSFQVGNSLSKHLWVWMRKAGLGQGEKDTVVTAWNGVGKSSSVVSQRV